MLNLHQHRRFIVAFIDDGINSDYISRDIAFESYIADENEVRVAPPVNSISHGTLCHHIFSAYVLAPYRLISIQVLNDETGMGNHKSLVAALDWCARREIDVINISLGTQQYTDFASIAEKIKRLHDTIIVAACSNQNELTFPACLPQVIGVRHCSHEALREGFAYLHDAYDQIEVLICAKEVTLTTDKGVGTTASAANSYAAPVISAYICNYLVQGIMKSENIRQQLEADAVPFSFNCGFYEKLIHIWEEPSIPMVAVMCDDPGIAREKMAAIINIMVSEGYRAIGLSLNLHTDAEDLIFHLPCNADAKVSLPDLITLYYNYAKPDIIFLHMDVGKQRTLPEVIRPETVLCMPDKLNDTCGCWEKKNILNLCDDATILVEGIEHLYI